MISYVVAMVMMLEIGPKEFIMKPLYYYGLDDTDPADLAHSMAQCISDIKEEEQKQKVPVACIKEYTNEF